MFRVGIGQDSHRFLSKNILKPCVIGGVIFPDVPGLDADSDGDVVFHSLCNAISSITGVQILGGIAITLCKEGITDSSIYVQKALETLSNQQILHVAFALEGKTPCFSSHIEFMRHSVAKLVGLEISQVGMTATSGNHLSDFARGEGIQCFCIVTVRAF